MMRKTEELSDYIKQFKIETEKIGDYLNFLEGIDTPLEIYADYPEYDTSNGVGGFSLYSKDYSLATDFEIEKRVDEIGFIHDGEGGIHEYEHSLYPQFYFTLKRGSEDIQVLIQHKGFEKDKRILIKSSTVTSGSGTGIEYIDTNKTLSFFKRKGVKKPLVDKLQKKIDEINKLYI